MDIGVTIKGLTITEETLIADNVLDYHPSQNDVSAANFLKFIISSAMNTTQGMRDSKEKIMPNTPADEGTIIRS